MGEESGPLDPAVFQDAVTKLQEIGVISDPQFWMDNAKPGKFIDVNPVRELVIAAARKYEEVDGVEQALDVLHKNKILLNIEKWNTDLVNSPKVAGGAVSLLIIALAKSIN